MERYKAIRTAQIERYGERAVLRLESRGFPRLIPELEELVNGSAPIDRNPRSPIRTLPSVRKDQSEHPQIRTIEPKPKRGIGILRGIIRTLRGR